jgi:ABC-type transport system involved in multi-copper enzyme maturation permease subunit
LLYHELNIFFLLLSAGSLCISISAHEESVFQAVSRSYPWLALMGVFAIGGGFALPWVLGALFNLRSPEPTYYGAAVVVIPLHVIFASNMIGATIRRMEYLRKSEKRGTKKSTGAMALSDAPVVPQKPGKRGQVKSRIHPLAWPVRGDAIFWKECLKDGTRWSLTVRWVLIGMGLIPIAGVLFRLLALSGGRDRGEELSRAFAGCFSYTAYFISLAAFAMVLLLQTTMSVAGEREHGTLPTLLLVPESRAKILLAKWLGPWWLNWPILAIAYLGAALGLSSGVTSFGTTLLMLILPLPALLMLSGLALWLSVMSRRVLFANTAVVGILGVFVIAHAALGRQTQMIFSFHLALLGDRSLDRVMTGVSWLEASAWALGEMALFLAIAGVCLWASFRKFAHRDYTGH